MKRFLLPILMSSFLLFGAACGEQPIEGTVVEKEKEAGEWDCLKKDKNGKCSSREWDDEDCILSIKPPKEANETDERYARVEPVEVEVPCNKEFENIRVGDYWSR